IFRHKEKLMAKKDKNTEDTTPTQASFDAAQSFLQAMLVSPTLAQEYATVGQQAQANNDPSAITDWLQAQNPPYNTTPTQIMQARGKMQDTRLWAWRGF